jgi:hypothetical protein
VSSSASESMRALIACSASTMSSLKGAHGAEVSHLSL